MKLSTGSVFDKLLDGGVEDDAITNIYGPAGSGKTNIALLCVMACLRRGRKCIYIDTEGSFSFDRFAQIGGTEKDLKNIMLIDVHEWKEQAKKVAELEKLVEKENAGLVVIDSMVSLYRLEMSDKNFSEVNKQLSTQYSILSKISRQRKIPVVVTNQIYTAGESVEITSKTISRYWSKVLIELKKTDRENHRTAIIRKHRSMPEGKKLEFEITADGIKEPGKFGIF